MRKTLPVDDLARDDRFVRVPWRIASTTRRSPKADGRQRPGSGPAHAQRPEVVRRRPRADDGIFVGEIQALEGAGRTCWDFETGDEAGRGALRAQARHGPPVLGRGPPLRDLREAQRLDGHRDRRVRRVGPSSTRRPATPTRCSASPA